MYNIKPKETIKYDCDLISVHYGVTARKNQPSSHRFTQTN